jgi:predicted tellurium resistance membrane protein TerC
MLTILVADVTMSLDNILAVGGLAHGEILVLTIGLLVSVAILLVGSAIVAGLIRRMQWLMDLAALVLGWTAGSMVHSDKYVGSYLNGAMDSHLRGVPFAAYILPLVGALIVALIDIAIRLWWGRHSQRQSHIATPEPGERVKSR